jgi:hypothetical protein
VTAYQVRFLPEASDELAALDKAVGQRILKKLKRLAENFEALTTKRGDVLTPEAFPNAILSVDEILGRTG